MEYETGGIRTVLTLRTTPENVENILNFYREEKVLEESLRLTRASSTEIAHAVDNTGEVIVTAVWPDDGAYQEWVDHEARAEIAEGLSVVLNGVVSVGKMYRVEHRVQRR